MSKNKDTSLQDMSFLDELLKCYLQVFFKKILESTQFKFNLDKICYYTIFRKILPNSISATHLKRTCPKRTHHFQTSLKKTRRFYTCPFQTCPFLFSVKMTCLFRHVKKRHVIKDTSKNDMTFFYMSKKTHLEVTCHFLTCLKKICLQIQTRLFINHQLTLYHT